MHSYLLIAVMAVVTIIIRFLPFMLFSKKVPAFISYLGETLPYCTMAMLVVFCLRDVDVSVPSQFLPSLTGIFTAVGVYRMKKSPALAIVSSTLVYMFLIQYLYR